MTLQMFLSDLDLVQADLIQMQMDHDLWCGLNENLRHNAHAGEPGDAMSFITRSHFAAFGCALRRQVDRDNRTVSLAFLIHKIASRQITFRRDEFVARYMQAAPAKYEAFRRRLGDNDFTHLSASPNCALYPPPRAYRHLEWLSKRATPLRDYVDKAIAHRDRKQPQYHPTIRYHRRLLWAMQRLAEHYQWLATGSFTRLESGFIGDEWRLAFARPWMPISKE